MRHYKYYDAYSNIKAPVGLADKVLNKNTDNKEFSYKSLISIVACVIILLSAFPMYLGFTNPDVSISADLPIAARSLGTQIPIRLELNREAVVTVSHGELEDYSGENLRGNVILIWNIDTEEYEDCTLTVRDSFKSSVYSLSYNVNNGSWAIIKN